MFSERPRARLLRERAVGGNPTRTSDRDWALTLGTALAVIGVAGNVIALIVGTDGVHAGRAADLAGAIAFAALAFVFELVGRVRHLQRRLDARERLVRYGRELSDAHRAEAPTKPTPVRGERP